MSQTNLYKREEWKSHKAVILWDAAVGAFFCRDCETGKTILNEDGERWFCTCTKCHAGRVIAENWMTEGRSICKACGTEYNKKPEDWFKNGYKLKFCVKALEMLDNFKGKNYSEIVDEVMAVQAERGFFPVCSVKDDCAATFGEAVEKPKNRQAAKLDAHELNKAISSIGSVDLTIPRDTLFAVVDLLFRAGASVESFWHRANAIEVMLATLEKSVRRLEQDMKAALDKMGGTPQTAKRAEEEPVPEPKSKFPIGHPLHMSTEEMKAADTALFTQTGGRMGKDWRNTEEKKEPPVLIYEENGENWSYCKKCGVSFRLKRGEGEKDL